MLFPYPAPIQPIPVMRTTWLVRSCILRERGGASTFAMLEDGDEIRRECPQARIVRERVYRMSNGVAVLLLHIWHLVTAIIVVLETQARFISVTQTLGRENYRNPAALSSHWPGSLQEFRGDY